MSTSTRVPPNSFLILILDSKYSVDSMDSCFFSDYIIKYVACGDASRKAVAAVRRDENV